MTMPFGTCCPGALDLAAALRRSNLCDKMRDIMRILDIVLPIPGKLHGDPGIAVTQAFRLSRRSISFGKLVHMHSQRKASRAGLLTSAHSLAEVDHEPFWPERH